MARGKGMGNLQREKGGNWTMRVSFHGKRLSRSTGTSDKAKAERFLDKFLSPLGLGKGRLPLGEVWNEFLKSPDRRDLAPSTLNMKRLVWRDFARWMAKNHLEVDSLAGVTHELIAQYLACMRVDVCASTYNSRVCVLRNIFHCLANKAGLTEDPWAGVCLRVDDSHSRRELTLDEIDRLMKAAAQKGVEWLRLFMIGTYTGLRLGDCCRLEWSDVNLERGVIQVIPNKTKKFANGHPVTIPIHASLLASLSQIAPSERVVYVLPTLASHYRGGKWYVTQALKNIFSAAHIETSIMIDGRRTRTPEATFHSLRHTFVSLAANAGVSLSVIAAIVGHESTAMTRHYYHESEAALRMAVEAIPSIDELRTMGRKRAVAAAVAAAKPKAAGGGASVESRLRKLEKLCRKGLISQEEYSALRQRILEEV